MHSLQIKDIHYQLIDGHQKRHLLKGCDIKLNSGEKVLITGASGSGKTTLLNIILGYLHPSQGEVFWGEQNIVSLNTIKKDQVRSRHCGVVFQHPYFLDELTVLENIILPLKIQKKSINIDEVEAMASQFGLNSNLLQQQPSFLSGGERTRANLLRSLMHYPQFLIADEPTAALDSQMSQKVFESFADHALFANKGLLVVSHDVNISEYFDRVYQLINGTLEEMDV
jgi:ABC-type lipoprotein export system ATPase subunit